MTGSPIRPFVVPPDWRGRDSCPSRPLLPTSDQAPLVAYGIERADRVEFITHAIAQSNGWDASSLDTAVTTWLTEEGRQPDLTRTLRDGVPVWHGRGTETMASQVLSQGLLRGLASDLASDDLYVSVPSRLALLAASHPETLLRLAREAFQESRARGEPTISPDLLHIRNGEIVALITNVPSSSTDVAWTRPTLTWSGSGANRRCVLDRIVALDRTELIEAIKTELDAVLDRLGSEPDFSGHIDIRVATRVQQPEPSFPVFLDQLSNAINDVCARASLTTRTGKPLRVQLAAWS